MNARALVGAFLCVAFTALFLQTAWADEGLGPWRPKSCVNLELFGAVHFVDHTDVNHYISEGDVHPFQIGDGKDNYVNRATPLYGLRLGMVFNRLIADLQLQYYRLYQSGHLDYRNDQGHLVLRSSTGAMLSGVQFLVHLGFDLVQTPFQVYPFIGLGWSYTNFVVNGDDQKVQLFPDFAGAKEGIPADVGLGFELQNPIWKTEDITYRSALNVPVFLHIGYQGELITYFWQVKHGNLKRQVEDRFMGPYVRLGVGFGKGKYLR